MSYLSKLLKKDLLEKAKIYETQNEELRRQNNIQAGRLRELTQQLEDYRWRFNNQRDVVQLMCERAEASPEEIAQLGVGRFVPGDKKRGIEDRIEYYTLDDLATIAEDAMKRQATQAKFRQLKQHFVKHQQAVTVLLDQLNELAGKNVLTTMDIEKFRRVRDELSLMIKGRV